MDATLAKGQILQVPAEQLPDPEPAFLEQQADRAVPQADGILVGPLALVDAVDERVEVLARDHFGQPPRDFQLELKALNDLRLASPTGVGEQIVFGEPPTPGHLHPLQRRDRQAASSHEELIECRHGLEDEIDASRLAAAGGRPGRGQDCSAR